MAVVLSLLLEGCAIRHNLAPVEELRWRESRPANGYHVVRRGETLYSVAFRYDRDYRQLAAYNHITSPYALHIGQRIKINPSRFHFATPSSYQQSNYIRPKYKPAIVPKKQIRIIKPADRIITSYNGQWQWPAKGRVVSYFSPNQGKKGIDIAGNKGTFVKAAAAGTVAYAGSGLAGYGNLIIIKHSGQYLTAYANNLKNLVREGQTVKVGQTIAEMGIIERKFWGVHFEIRKEGQPVNPLNFLGKD